MRRLPARHSRRRDPEPAAPPRRDDLRDVYGKLARDHDFILSRRDEPKTVKGMAGKAVEALEVAAGAGAVGVLAGRLQTWSIPGTPLPLGLALGVAGHAIDAMGFAGSYGEHVSNFSNGLIAGWATMVGASKGRQMREKAGQPIGDITAGTGDAIGCGVGCAPQQLAAAPVNMGARPMPLTEAQIAAARHR